MAGSSTKNWERLITGFWMLNLVLGITVVAAWQTSSHPPVEVPAASPIPQNTATTSPTVPPSFTPTTTQSSTTTETTTLTETTTSTETPTQTMTPIPFWEGPLTIGKSVQKRPLEVYRFGFGPTNRLIVAGIHGGGEYNTIQLADQLIAYLQGHPEIIPADITLYILRDLNPDGEARAHGVEGRANANGVDLNRNWDANWQINWPRAGCWIYTVVTGGTRPGSEPETQALMKFILGHNIDAIINYHSAALGVFAGGLPPDDKSIRLAKAIAAVSTYQYPPVNTGCDYTGGFIDWADIHGAAAVDLELTNHTDTDFEMNLRVLNIFLNWKR
ncbi:MAG TPA: M14 family metallopeptidase [Anaerolineales bacterium]